MDYPYNESQNQPDSFMETWHKQEKMSERLAGVILLFAGALTFVLEPQQDQIALMVLVAFFAGGITVLIHSRRPQESRLGLHFLRYDKQMRNAGMVGFLAALALMFGEGRPIAIIVAVLLAGLALWLQWRGGKVRQLTAMFAKADDEQAEN